MSNHIVEIITALLGSTLLAAVVPKAIDGYKAWKSGKAEEEKLKNRSALGRLFEAEEKAEREEAKADMEAEFRRKLEEYASVLRRLLVQMGYPEEKLPPWPVRRSKIKY